MLTKAGFLLEPSEVAIENAPWLSERFSDEINQCLVAPDPDMAPFFRRLEIGRLTESVSTEVDTVGVSKDWPDGQDRFRGRSKALERLFHDQSSSIRRHIRKSLGRVKAVSCSSLTVRYAFRAGSSQIDSQAYPERAFFDREEHELIVAEPVDVDIWFEVFRATFHELIPDYSGSISHIIGNAVSIIEADSLEHAHRWLDLAGFPTIDTGGIGRSNRPDSEDLGALGEGDLDDEVPGSRDSDENEQTEGQKGAREEKDRERAGGDSDGEEPLDERAPSTEGDERDSAGSQAEGDSGRGTGSRGRKHARREAAQRARLARWLSYVEPRKDQERRTRSRDEIDENLELARAAVTAACQFEIGEGREPTPKAHNQPGYDIESIDETSGETRYIEVKGIGGEWGGAGVRLTRTQFLKAQSDEEEYWLYVVEYCLDPKRAKVHAIQNPAEKVDMFCFDKNWRYAAETSGDVLDTLFSIGQRIHDDRFGQGSIVEVRRREVGRPKLLIAFDSAGRKELPLDPDQMVPIDEDYLAGEEDD